MFHKFASFLLLLFTSAMVATAPRSLDDLQVSDAWVRAMPPVSKMTAAYASFTNSGKQEIKIIGFSSPQYRSVSLHQTVVGEDGLSRMEELPQLLVGAGQTVALQPGGKHLMLMSPTEENPAKINIVITFSDKSSIEMEFDIKNKQSLLSR